jgi:hypothetical protein
MKLPIPQRGQPLDVTFISDIVRSVNDLYDKVAIKVSAYANLWTVGGRKQVRSSEVKFVSGQVKINTEKTTSSDQYVDFEYRFDIAFKFAPIVTATPISLRSGGASKAAKDATVILTDVTTNSVRGTAKFETIGEFTVGVNIIAIGIPV